MGGGRHRALPPWPGAKHRSFPAMQKAEKARPAKATEEKRYHLRNSSGLCRAPAARPSPSAPAEGLQADVCPAHASQGKHQLMSDGGAIDAGTWRASSFREPQIAFVTPLLCRGKAEAPSQANEPGVQESKPRLPSPQASAHPGSLSGAAAGGGRGNLTGSVPAGEALASLARYARVARAHQLCVGSAVREASIEEARPGPRAESKAHSSARAMPPARCSGRTAAPSPPTEHRHPKAVAATSPSSLR